VKVNLTQAFVQSVESVNTDVYDTQQPGLVLRTRSSGTHSYRVLLKHGQWYTLGSSSVLTPAAARELSRQVLGDLAPKRSGCSENGKGPPGPASYSRARTANR
jgi:hypothetical protein